MKKINKKNKYYNKISCFNKEYKLIHFIKKK